MKKIYIITALFICFFTKIFAQPATPATTPPTRNTTDVLSIYSNAYTNIDSTDFYPNRGQGGAKRPNMAMLFTLLSPMAKRSCQNLSAFCSKMQPFGLLRTGRTRKGPEDSDDFGQLNASVGHSKSPCVKPVHRTARPFGYKSTRPVADTVLRYLFRTFGCGQPPVDSGPDRIFRPTG